MPPIYASISTMPQKHSMYRREEYTTSPTYLKVPLLAGIGLIEKEQKNQIRWKGVVNLTEMTHEEAELWEKKGILESLEADEAELNKRIAACQEEIETIADSQKYDDYAYISQDDLVNYLYDNCSDSLIITIKAPVGSSIQEYDPKDLVEYYDKQELELKEKLKEKPNDPTILGELEDIAKIRTKSKILTITGKGPIDLTYASAEDKLKEDVGFCDERLNIGELFQKE
jgi:hypothetical protein